MSGHTPSELLPCPFCGGPAGEVAFEFITCLSAEVGAEQNCPGKLIRLDVEDAEQWNKRAANEAKIEALTQALEPFVILANAIFENYEIRPGEFREAYCDKPDDHEVWGFNHTAMTYGHLRRARAALTSAGEK